jgi:acetyltransferase-like isoleucine patch superfamily enzyme
VLDARDVNRELRSRFNVVRKGRRAVIGNSTYLTAESKISNHMPTAHSITIGDHCVLRGHLLTYGHGGQISIGDWCYVGHRTEIWSMANISIGDRVLIAHDVNIHDGNAHPVIAEQRHRHFRAISSTGHPEALDEIGPIAAEAVSIGDDVWISFGVTILKGVSIGARSVIGAGSTVTSNVPPDSTYISVFEPRIKRSETS